MVSNYLSVLVLWIKVVSALEELDDDKYFMLMHSQ